MEDVHKVGEEQPTSDGGSRTHHKTRYYSYSYHMYKLLTNWLAKPQEMCSATSAGGGLVMATHNNENK